jgi:hypothetical protein
LRFEARAKKGVQARHTRRWDIWSAGVYRGSGARVRLGPELFQGVGVLPGPATGSHIVNRATPVGPSPTGTAAAECPEEEEPPAWRQAAWAARDSGSGTTGAGRVGPFGAR